MKYININMMTNSRKIYNWCHPFLVAPVKKTNPRPGEALHLINPGPHHMVVDR